MSNDVQLEEASRLIADKDKEIERQRLQIGELELKIEDLKKKPSDQLAKLQVEYDAKCQENRELREVLHAKNQNFAPASSIESPKSVWVAAVNAINLFKGLHEGSRWAIEHNDPWKKVVFTVGNDGQLTDARPEGT